MHHIDGNLQEITNLDSFETQKLGNLIIKRNAHEAKKVFEGLLSSIKIELAEFREATWRIDEALENAPESEVKAHITLKPKTASYGVSRSVILFSAMFREDSATQTLVLISCDSTPDVDAKHANQVFSITQKALKQKIKESVV